MKGICIAFLALCSVCIFSGAHASALDLARELHSELNSVDRETMPDQFAAIIAQTRPEYRAKGQELKRLILTVLDSKEYESIRADYFSKAFSEQELRAQLALVRSPAFKLHQRKMTESAKFSGVALMGLVQRAVAQSADSLKPSVSSQPTDQSRESPKIITEQNGRITNYRPDGSLASTQTIGCIPLAEVKSTLTPPDLYKGVGECLGQENYNSAARLFALAGVYARFDAERVTDKSAGQAKTVLIMNTFSSLPQDKKNKFNETLSQITKNGESLEKLCGEVQRIGMPNYYPRYMILHGIKAFTGNPHDEALLKDFDSSKTWKSLQTGYLNCPS